MWIVLGRSIASLLAIPRIKSPSRSTQRVAAPVYRAACSIPGQQHNQGTQEDLRKEQQGTQEDLVSRSDHKKEDQDGCNEKQSQEPKQSELSDVVLPAQGWTSWQEMAAKKCPTKNLIVFN